MNFSLKTFNFFIKFGVKILFCRHHFSQLNTFMRKGKVSDPNTDPYLSLMDPDPGGPETCGPCGSGSPMLILMVHAPTMFICELLPQERV
jgi:hypothetical protein